MLNLFKPVTVKGNYYSFPVCERCEQRVTSSQEMYSNATCPHCGFKSRGTIMNTKNVIIKKLTFYPEGKFLFWNKKVSYVTNDVFSQKWLDKNC